MCYARWTYKLVDGNHYVTVGQRPRVHIVWSRGASKSAVGCPILKLLFDWITERQKMSQNDPLSRFRNKVINTSHQHDRQSAQKFYCHGDKGWWVFTGSLSEHGRLKVSKKWTHFERQSSSKWSDFYFNIFQRYDWSNPSTTRDHYDPPRKSVKFLYDQLAVGWARLPLCISPLTVASHSEKMYIIIESWSQGLWTSI